MNVQKIHSTTRTQLRTRARVHTHTHTRKLIFSAFVQKKLKLKNQAEKDHSKENDQIQAKKKI